MSRKLIASINPILRVKSIPVPLSMIGGEYINDLILDMLKVVTAAKGVGLAAPQVGCPYRVFIMMSGSLSKANVHINPYIEWQEGEGVSHEGCLSLPKMFCDVRRPMSLLLVSYDAQGAHRSREYGGIGAAIVAHEIDHLDGVLMTDRSISPQPNEEQ